MDVTNRYVDVNIEGELSYLIVNKSSIDEREKNRKKNKNEGILSQGNIAYHWTLKLFMLHRFRYERFVIKNKQDKIPWGISICVAHLIFSCSRICWMKKQQKKNEMNFQPNSERHNEFRFEAKSNLNGFSVEHSVAIFPGFTSVT